MTEKAQINPEKLKVLSAVMDKIEKDFGKGAIMKMSSTRSRLFRRDRLRSIRRSASEATPRAG